MSLVNLVIRVTEGSQHRCGAKDIRSFVAVETFSPSSMGFFLQQHHELRTFFKIKRYNALKWCTLWETAGWRVARCPMLGRSSIL